VENLKRKLEKENTRNEKLINENVERRKLNVENQQGKLKEKSEKIELYIRTKYYNI
tara:strand:+ start:140 stop:307 length:168 start_codon:yes stop_codon:yes gene_type:complete